MSVPNTGDANARRRTLFAALLLAATLTVPAAATGPVYVNTIPGGGATQRPSAFAGGAGQCSEYYHHLHWVRWGGKTAKATGKVSWREPNFDAGESCGSAPDITHRVTVRLTRRTTCNGRRYYLRVTTRYGSRDLDCGSSQG